MSPFNKPGKPGTQRLRVRLLVPIIFLVLAVGLGVAITGSFFASRHTEKLISRRGANVLGEMITRLEDRQRSKEIFARLLASEAPIVLGIENGDLTFLEQAMVPMKDRLGLEEVTVYDRAGQELLHIGPVDPLIDLEKLKSAALSGLSGSTLAVGAAGLTIAAVAPVSSADGIIGVVRVGVTLDNATMAREKVADDIELAIFHRGALVGTTLADSDDSELTRWLSQSRPTLGDLARIERFVEGFGFHPEAQNIGADGLILVLVPTRDLTRITQEYTTVEVIGGIVLIAALLATGLMLARAIATPLEAMVAAAKDVVGGRYGQKIPSSGIRELDDLASAFNHLGEQLQTQMAELAHQAFYDSLSQLPNRALFVDRLERALARRNKQANSVAVLFLDLDNFKVVNDSLGHQNGDELLARVADRLKGCLRAGDTASRLGGDEFTILLDEPCGLAGAIKAAERIQEALQMPFEVNGHELFLTASIGLALNTDIQDDAETLLRRADMAMYRAKAAGRDRYAVFEPSMNTQVVERFELETELRRAIERDELNLYYQPVIDLNNGTIVGVEALVRWVHPRRGLLPPLEFVRLAEETGLILALGRWVLRDACRQTREWQLHYPSQPPLKVSVNLSARQLQYPGLVDDIARALAESQLDPQSLQLEITESAAMENLDSIVALLDQLKGMGIGLAIDDFGTGYSSLAYVERFPVDVLKVDKAFVERLGQNPRDRAIVHAVAAFAKALNLVVIAEGVETADQLAALRVIGYDQVQGYYFSKPMPGEALGELLAIRSSIAQMVMSST